MRERSVTVEQLIIDKLDLWTSATTQKTTSGRGRNGKLELTGLKKLRELILELAVRGKLVPQDPADEPASVLLEKIAAEKARLVKEGKIKKPKALPEIAEDEKPFELPEGWEWVKLGEVAADIHYGFTASADHQDKEGIRLLRITDIQNDSVDWDRVPGCEIDSEKAQQYLLKEADLLIARTGGTIGKSYLVENLSVDSVFASYLIRIRKLDSCNHYYIKKFLGSTLYWDQLHQHSMGTGQPNVNGNALKNLLISIPPETEQHRVVQKVDELMGLCDRIENHTLDHLAAHETLVDTLLDTLTQAEDAEALAESWNRLAAHLDTLFTTEHSCDRLKQTILQLAVMGRLVPQDPTDEPASVLLEKIAAEKARLVKEGKIKEPKVSDAIGEDEKPFEVPEGWNWARMNAAVIKITDGTHHSPPNTDHGDLMYVSAKNIKPEGVQTDMITYVTREIHREIYSRCNPECGDILYIKDGATTGIATINNLNVEFSMLSSVALLKCNSSSIFNEFLLYCLRAPFFYEEMRAGMTGVAITRVTLKKLELALIPIPPLAEQHRIVQKVDALMALCDQLKARLAQADDTRRHLATALVDQAIQ